MSRKKKKVVQPVEEKKPSQDDIETVSEESPQEVTPPELPPIPFDISRISPDKLKLAQAAGIPLQEILTWIQTVELRFQAIEKELPQTIRQNMEAAITAVQQKQMEQMRQYQSSGGGRTGGTGDLMTLMQMFGGGGGQDEEIIKLTKDMMRMNLERMKADLGFTDAIKQAVVTKIAGKATKEIME